MLRRLLSEAIEIETVVDGGLWRCEADAGQLEESLLNLALNSRDAMPDGGKLTIEAGNARLDDAYAASQVEMTPGQYVVISVTDTGVGIPVDVRNRVFEPFFTTKEVGQGTELGMSMVYGFAKQSGGHAAVYSEQGIGTTVKIYLPRIMDEVEQTAPAGAATGDLTGRGETILLVEDDEDLRVLAVEMLRDLGYEVIDAPDGDAALELIETATHLDLILTDVVLPGGMNGRALAEEVRRRIPEIRILYMSGYTKNAIIHHGRLDKDAVLLQKPFRKQDLAQMVRSVLD
jgi:CheY-like chemotaxis protein